MYLAYVDESGFSGRGYNPYQPVLVMTCILPNVYNFHKSDSEFKEVFNIIKSRIPLSEIKGEEIYRGRKSWRKVKPNIREAVIEFYLNWIVERKHLFIITAIDNAKFFELRKDPKNFKKLFDKIPYPYLLAGLHIALIIQKINRKKTKNKGKTILIFDEQEDFSDYLADLIFKPPDFIDDFVTFDSSKEKYRLNQIVDTAFFVKSHHSSMAQVVDIVSYLMRLFLELNFYGTKEAYPGEKEKISKWIFKIKDKFLPFKQIYPKKQKPFISFINEVKAKGIDSL